VSARVSSGRRRILKTAAGGALGLVLGGSALLAGAEPDKPKKGFAPDPPPRASLKQWIFDIEVEKGRVRIDKIRTVTLKKPRSTLRVMGRYAIELYIGNELLDRIRFNVPIAGDGPREGKGPFSRPRFDQVNASLMVRIADNPRATYGQLVDRATEKVTRFSWPPEPAGSSADAGSGAVPDAGAGASDAGASSPGKGDAGAGDGGAADAGPAPDAAP
jgi:hypothetical protein